MQAINPGAQAATGNAAAAGTHAGGHSGSATHGARHAAAYIFLNAEEARFLEAAVERLIPADDVGPGALQAGVPSFIDKQLGGAWGAGERLYRGGPWSAGTPTQGYQLPFTPAELFRHAVRGLNQDVRRNGGKPFEQLTPEQQDAYLTSLEKGQVDLNGVPSNIFFESLLSLTIEGYFSDPVYSGNKDMAAWKMIGFPGAYAAFYTMVDQHNMLYTRAPMSLAEDANRVIHIHPEIPARDIHQGEQQSTQPAIQQHGHQDPQHDLQKDPQHDLQQQTHQGTLQEAPHGNQAG